MKMADDNKEIVFYNITRWLRESDFVISEEKITVVTSEFYAKIYLHSDQEHIIELISSSGFETRFVLRIRLRVSEQKIEIYENYRPNEKLALRDKINTVIFSRHQSFTIRNKSALLEKIILIDPKSIDAKQDLIQNVSSLLESARRLEITFDEIFSI
jgi:hypothetical protein